MLADWLSEEVCDCEFERKKSCCAVARQGLRRASLLCGGKGAKYTFEGVSKECSVRKEERCGGWEGETCAGVSGCVVRYAGAEKKRFIK